MRAAVLINGVSLPHHVIDCATSWAVANKSSLHTIFVYQSTSKHPHHGWPANKAVSRFMSGDLFAEGNLIDLIDRHVKYTISCCALSNVNCEIDVLKNPSLEDIKLKVSSATKVFADQDTFMRPRDFAYTSILSSDLDMQYGGKIIWCRNQSLNASRKVAGMISA